MQNSNQRLRAALNGVGLQINVDAESPPPSFHGNQNMRLLKSEMYINNNGSSRESSQSPTASMSTTQSVGVLIIII